MNRYIYITLFFLVFWSRWGDAKDIHITIQGTLRAPACTVTGTDGKKSITVSFGAVKISEIDSAEKDIQLQVDCDSPLPENKLLKIKINAEPYYKNSMDYKNLFKTSMDGLAIGFMKDGQPISLNAWIDINNINIKEDKPKGTVTLTTRLFNRGSNTLKTGVFNSSANIVLKYE
ncbi:type 1 fimbrial protein [Xenorhabdus sp. 12]|uniref:Type 1 fimbrial protein n=1 Tax=Xenorhabdus santafensis TaxID=2582833 RepID=A0ABU4S785_9GAMM|nr:fimbrial protein [Xenorhabdus sp. 12]MDX7986633.1 type 1 fimbrial protein [Xenorhabdus sp. 12]